VTDRGTDRQTDRILIAIPRVCITCNAVKMSLLYCTVVYCKVRRCLFSLECNNCFMQIYIISAHIILMKIIPPRVAYHE